MRARTVNENINFERNQSPKRSIGIGGESRVLKKYGEELGPQMIRLKPILDSYGFKEIRFDLNNDGIPHLVVFSLDDEDVFFYDENREIFNIYRSSVYDTYLVEFGIIGESKEDEAIKLLDEVSINDFIKWFGNIEDRLEESINFERGKDPRKIVGVGEEVRKKNIIKKIMQFDTSNINYMGMRHEYNLRDYQHMYAMDNYMWVEKWMMEEDINILQQLLDDIIERNIHFSKNLNIVKAVTESIGFTRGRSVKKTLNIGKISRERFDELYNYFTHRVDWFTFHKLSDANQNEHPYIILAKDVLVDKFENLDVAERLFDLIYQAYGSIEEAGINDCNNWKDLSLKVINSDKFNSVDWTMLPSYSPDLRDPISDIYSEFTQLLKTLNNE